MLIRSSFFHSFPSPFYLLMFSTEEDTSEGHFGVRYEVSDVPVNLPLQKPPADKPNPKQGIGKCHSVLYSTYSNKLVFEIAIQYNCFLPI